MLLGPSRRLLLKRWTLVQSLYWSAQGSGLIYNQALSIVSTRRNVGEVLHLEQAQSAGSGRRAMRVAAAAILAACVGLIAGCGNTYRPVLSTIGAVGPAGQPTKYAVAVSTPTQTPVGGQIVFVGTWSATTTYSI